MASELSFDVLMELAYMITVSVKGSEVFLNKAEVDGSILVVTHSSDGHWLVYTQESYRGKSTLTSEAVVNAIFKSTFPVP